MNWGGIPTEHFFHGIQLRPENGLRNTVTIWTSLTWWRKLSPLMALCDGNPPVGGSCCENIICSGVQRVLFKGRCVKWLSFDLIYKCMWIIAENGWPPLQRGVQRMLFVDCTRLKINLILSYLISMCVMPWHTGSKTNTDEFERKKTLILWSLISSSHFSCVSLTGCEVWVPPQVCGGGDLLQGRGFEMHQWSLPVRLSSMWVFLS